MIISILGSRGLLVFVLFPFYKVSMNCQDQLIQYKELQEWLAYAKSISGSFTKMTDVFRPTEDNDWEETDKPATDLTGASLRIDASTNSLTTGDVLQWTANNKFSKISLY